MLKFMFSKKATKIDEIFIAIWPYVASVKSPVKISSIFVAFLENTNFTIEAKQVSKASMRHNGGNLQKSLTEHTAHHKACKGSFFY